MPLTRQKRFHINYTYLAFLLPVLTMFGMMYVRGFEPFGDLTMLYSDMYHQYYPFFLNFRNALRSGSGLLYNWSLGMGMDYLGLISYYLASPLNLLSIFVPESMLLEYFSLLVPIKMGLAGMFFAIFLKKLFNKNDFSIVVFGSFYAMCAWAMGYSWNVMWLDTFALLPLVALGLISLLEKRKVILYTVTLFLSVFINYYIGLFTCIFVALVFLCYEICRWKGFKKFFSDLGCVAGFSALALGMTAILTLPAYAALQNTQSSVNTFPKGFELNIADKNTWKGFFDAMRQVAGNMNGSIAPTYKEGLPNLYCGIATNFFAFLFLTSRHVKLRDKICSVVLILFFNVSFILRQLDYIWHGFHFTNMIPYRFSFLHSFVMLYLAYRAWLLRNRFKIWQILAGGALAASLLLCVKEEQDTIFWAYNGVFLVIYLTLLLYPKLMFLPNRDSSTRDKHYYVTEKYSRRRFSSAAILVVICAELILNVINFGMDFTGTIVTNYPKGTTYSASMIRYMKERSEDDPFYRAEVTHSQTLNDSALNGYNGISTFTSSANVNVTRFMKALGYGAKETYNRYCFEESSPVSNLFLNLKYMIERDGRVEENNYFDEVHNYGKVWLLENNAYLPLGFLANPAILNTSVASTSNTFTFQNQLFRDATGIPDPVWYTASGRTLTITGRDVTVKPEPTMGYTYYTADAQKGGTVTYEYQIWQEGLFCIDLNLPQRNNISVWKNGAELFTETYSIRQSLAVSQVTNGDVIQVKLTCAPGSRGSATIRTAILNELVFRNGYDRLAASTLNITKFSSTHVEGTIDCDRDGVLYTSIPQDGNWTATIDGKPAQIAVIGDVMVGLLLTKGQHTITFTYKNEAFSLGWKISLISLIVFLFLCRLYHKPVEKKILPAKRKKPVNLPQITEKEATNDTTVSENPGELPGSQDE